LTADNEALDLDDDIDDDINYEAHTDEVINNNYVSDEQNVRAFDYGIDLDGIQNIINLVESLDADSISSVPSTISTATDEKQTYFTSTHLSFAQMTVNQVISSNIQSSRSSFASFAPSTSEIISSTVIDSD
jgi:hypothetical protein